MAATGFAPLPTGCGLAAGDGLFSRWRREPCSPAPPPAPPLTPRAIGVADGIQRWASEPEGCEHSAAWGHHLRGSTQRLREGCLPTTGEDPRCRGGRERSAAEGAAISAGREAGEWQLVGTSLPVWPRAQCSGTPSAAAPRSALALEVADGRWRWDLLPDGWH